MNGFKQIIRYWKAGRLLHLVASLAFTMAVFSFITLIKINYHYDSSSWFIWLAIFIIFFNMAVLAELDGYSRYQNYKQVKDQMFLNGYQERQLNPLLKSSCQREAALLATTELGLGNKVRNYFFAKGYRWYHILPDFLFENPLFLFTGYFWRTTFFAPFYPSKIDYDALECCVEFQIELSKFFLKQSKT
jgi:hypothetical protein